MKAFNDKAVSRAQLKLIRGEKLSKAEEALMQQWRNRTA